MNKTKDFWRLLKDFFVIYLPKQRNYSIHTINACHKTWNMLIKYLNEEKNISNAQINFGMFEPTIVLSFLDHMEIEKHWKISTRNQRLSCIRMFFEYAAMTEPMLYSVYASLKSIPLKKDVNKTMTVDYLTETAVSAIINAPDTTTRLGMRDNFFLALMYDVAARDCEMLSMKKSDLNIDNSTLCLLGKGNKPRIVPVSKKTIELGKRYIALFHAEEDAHMFYTIHRGSKTKMSDDNVARFLKKYAKQASKTVTINEKVHPHIIRKSRAMHLYRSGMPLALLAEFLGHSDPQVTQIYAYADTEMKREAIEKASTRLDYSIDAIPFWKGNEDIIERLCRGY